ncbi:winged helix DNA-binding domain-containing protein [Dactylosporangium sp. NPDC000244]|uniref:winged helix DNA-binding domain-containing protein n=1 Tax=Dactylosporangium sp. NPDC000244 TaxID=3154365 RepID=UPI003331F857
MDDDERRARLGVRQALAIKQASPEAVAEAVVGLHATEPASVYLAAWARAERLQVEDVDRALYRDRTLVKQLAMRRTLFVFPRSRLGAVWGSASARVAANERARMAREVVAAGIDGDGQGWLERARAAILAVLDAHPEGLTAAEIRVAVPMIDVRVTVTPTDPWSSSRLLTWLGAAAEIVRGENTAARQRWTLTRNWVPEEPREGGYRELVEAWLRAFGPGTEDDIVWWLGATKTVVRKALAELDAVQVSLDNDDTGEVGDPGPWVALLPVLDPTVMGWRDRDFYLGPHQAQIVDGRGNAGTTAWADGRVVGCWTQDDAGVVRVHLLRDVPRKRLDEEAERLTAWSAGFRVPTAYRSPAMRAGRFPA